MSALTFTSETEQHDVMELLRVLLTFNCSAFDVGGRRYKWMPNLSAKEPSIAIGLTNASEIIFTNPRLDVSDIIDAEKM